MQTIQLLKFLATLTLTVASVRADEDWRRVAFVGDAQVKSISGVVEIATTGQERSVRPGEKATAGQTLRIYRGAEVILMMDRSQSLVRAKGPTMLRLAPMTEGYDRASIEENSVDSGFAVRAVRGSAKYKVGQRWVPLKAGTVIPVGTQVRPGHDTILDFYHASSGTVARVTDSSRPTTLRPTGGPMEVSGANIMAAKAP
jgi:hypothetical protein